MVVGHSTCHHDLHARGSVEVRKTQPVRAAGADSPPEFAILARWAAPARAPPRRGQFAGVPSPGINPKIAVSAIAARVRRRRWPRGHPSA